MPDVMASCFSGLSLARRRGLPLSPNWYGPSFSRTAAMPFDSPHIGFHDTKIRPRASGRPLQARENSAILSPTRAGAPNACERSRCALPPVRDDEARPVVAYRQRSVERELFLRFNGYILRE